MKSMLPLALLAVVTTFACATTDPNKQVKEADAAHVTDVKEGEVAEAKLAADQEGDHAALDSAHAKEDGAMDQMNAEDAAKWEKERAAAMANVVEARRTFQAEAISRLDQVDAKAKAIEAKRAAKKQQPEATLTMLRTNYFAARTDLAGLGVVADNKWFYSKKQIEKKLTALEKDMGDLENRL
jgi:hypothetical protein